MANTTTGIDWPALLSAISSDDVSEGWSYADCEGCVHNAASRALRRWHAGSNTVTGTGVGPTSVMSIDPTASPGLDHVLDDSLGVRGLSPGVSNLSITVKDVQSACEDINNQHMDEDE
jgi:hypothetical protein